MLRAGGGKAEPMMAAPPAHIVAKGKREAIEVVKRTLAPAGAHSDRSRNSVGVWLGQDNGLKELQVVSLPGEGVRVLGPIPSGSSTPACGVKPSGLESSPQIPF